MFTSSGIIVTNPTSKSTAVGEWWMILECCPELGRYYNQSVKFANRAKRDFKLDVPSWGYHISVLRGEPLSSPEAIEYYKAINGMEVEFTYVDAIQTNGRYFWLPVQCSGLLDAREALGLPRFPYYGFHLTIGVNPLVKEPEQ